ncbi:MAG: hypothetical protein AAGI90_03560 [Chlamydiota bacterium]
MNVLSLAGRRTPEEKTTVQVESSEAKLLQKIEQQISDLQTIISDALNLIKKHSSQLDPCNERSKETEKIVSQSKDAYSLLDKTPIKIVHLKKSILQSIDQSPLVFDQKEALKTTLKTIDTYAAAISDYFTLDRSKEILSAKFHKLDQKFQEVNKHTASLSALFNKFKKTLEKSSSDGKAGEQAKQEKEVAAVKQMLAAAMRRINLSKIGDKACQRFKSEKAKKKQDLGDIKNFT